LILVFIKLNLINLMPKFYILKKHIFVSKNRFSHKSPLLNNRYCLVFNRNMSTNINTNSLDNSNIHKSTDSKDLAFREWLAGLIDGDGYFLLSKNGYNSCEITMDARDKKVLYLIQHRYGGSIKQISNAYAFKYKLRNKAGLIALINDINGLIRNPTRLLQMNKLCIKFNIELKYTGNLTFNNGWFSGFIDSDGSIYYSELSGQVFISASQKNKYLLEPLIYIYGGRVDISSPKIETFKYIVYRKAELFNLIDNYFSKYPLRTEKMNRVNLIKQFYLLRLHRKSVDIVKINE
jgi:LAGLIDADG endonuclease